MRDFASTTSKKQKDILFFKSRFLRKQRRKKLSNQWFKKFFLVFVGIISFLITGLIILGGLYIKNLGESLPSPDKLVDRQSDQTTIIVDRDGNELYKIHADQNRKFVQLEELPEHLKWAILATEDINFYEHGGFDLQAILKAAYVNFLSKEIVRGASTITQQLIRNTILFDILGEKAYEETYARKIQEILITIQVEQNFTKDEILQMYINEVGFGGVNYGIQAASIAYFAKDAKDLTLAESAMLAGVIASPSNYSPIYSQSFDLPTRRQHAILDLMLKNKELTKVTSQEVLQAKRENLKYASLQTDIVAPHFVFHVKKELEEMYGLDLVQRGGLYVKTSLDSSLQEIAEQEIKTGIAQYGQRWNVNNGAMIVLDPKNNEILAMVGSINYWENENPLIDGNVNVTTRLRQMGSSVKPYTYLAAFEKGYDPNSKVPDKPNLSFGNYTVRNWDGKHFGDMTIRQALLQSRNVPAVYMTKMIGIEAFLDVAERVGITSLDRDSYYGLSVTLGTAEMTLLEHTAGFTVFVNGGVRKPVSPILEVTDSHGQILFKSSDLKEERVFEKKHTDFINWILCDKSNFGDQPLNHYYLINGRRALCGKTGTTDGPRDLVSIMYHKNLVVGVWAGNNNNMPVPGAWSTTVPLPIAHSFMQKVSNQYPPDFPQ